MSDPEELSRSPAYKECGVSNRCVNLSMPSLAGYIIPFAGELRLAA